MEFIETPVFTKRIQELLEADDYRDLQVALLHDPKSGSLISGAHGLRKIRWRSSKKNVGKRGGVRVIYYCLSHKKLYMIYVYEKSRQGDLSAQQLKTLSTYVKEGVL